MSTSPTSVADAAATAEVASLAPDVLSEEYLASELFSTLGFRPCKWQLEICRIMLARQHQVIVSTAATGTGKTLTFWLPLLVEKKEKKGTTFIIVPLKDLGQQMADDAALFGLSAFNATSETLKEKDAIKVCI